MRPEKKRKPLPPETDGWDRDGREHWNIRWLHRLFILVAVLVVGPGGYFSYRYYSNLITDRKKEVIRLESATDEDLRRISWRHRKLKHLKIDDCSNITNYVPLGYLTDLQNLKMRGNKKLTDLTPMKSMIELKELGIGDSHELTDLKPLEKLSGLRLLILYHCSGITNYSVAELRRKLPDCKIIKWP